MSAMRSSGARGGAMTDWLKSAGGGAATEGAGGGMAVATADGPVDAIADDVPCCMASDEASGPVGDAPGCIAGCMAPYT